MAAERAHQAAGTAADFERGVAGPRSRFRSRSRSLHHVGAGGEELLVVLLAAAEGDVIIGVFAGALVPIVAHALE